jgi:hypothetical protein
MPMGLHDVDRRPTAHPVLATDDVRQLDRLDCQCLQLIDQTPAFGASGRVVVHRFVDGRRYVGDRVHASSIPRRASSHHVRRGSEIDYASRDAAAAIRSSVAVSAIRTCRRPRGP